MRENQTHDLTKLTSVDAYDELLCPSTPAYNFDLDDPSCYIK